MIGKVKNEARQEKESIQKQIAEESTRERYQEEMTKTKEYLDYQNPGRYYGYGYYPYR